LRTSSFRRPSAGAGYGTPAAAASRAREALDALSVRSFGADSPLPLALGAALELLVAADAAPSSALEAVA
jgi:hypothetical protein